MIHEKASEFDEAIKAYSDFIEKAQDSFHSQKVQARQSIIKISN